MASERNRLAAAQGIAASLVVSCGSTVAFRIAFGEAARGQLLLPLLSLLLVAAVAGNAPSRSTRRALAYGIGVGSLAACVGFAGAMSLMPRLTDDGHAEEVEARLRSLERTAAFRTPPNARVVRSFAEFSCPSYLEPYISVGFSPMNATDLSLRQVVRAAFVNSGWEHTEATAVRRESFEREFDGWTARVLLMGDDSTLYLEAMDLDSHVCRPVPVMPVF